MLRLLVIYLWIILIHSQEVPTPSSINATPDSDTETVQSDCDSDNESCTASELDPSSPLYLLDHILSEEAKDYSCTNPPKHTTEQCENWKNIGECERNANWMVFSCPKQCGFCHLQDPAIRCARHPQAPQNVKPGDIDETFHRIINDFPQYTPEVLHREDPWVVLLHDVYTEEETDTMIRIGGRNFKRSVDAGKMSGNEAKFESVVSQARTSWNDWCVRGCWDNPIINGMAQKAENITRVPKENSEFFQVLRYNEGQYYVQHTDFIVGHLDLPIGPRVYTYYIYLNDVEEGGETAFGRLAAAVTPKRGNVVVWNNVKNDNPFKIEPMAHHEAKPVIKGIKYGANMWIHMYNFHQPYSVSCTG